MKNIIILFVILFFQVIPAITHASEGDLFLICNGDRFIEINKELIPYEQKITKSFEIKKKELVVDIVRGKEYRVKANKWNSNEIFYAIPVHPVISIVKNYFLSIDRISGYVVERSDVYPRYDEPSYWVFKGFCEKKVNRKF